MGKSTIEDIYSEGYKAHLSELKLFETEEGRNHIKQYAIDYVGFLGKGSILEIGCGTGVMVWAFQQQGREAFGCDISKWAVNNAVTHKISECSVQNLVYKDKSFDNVMAFDILEHVPLDEINKAISECERVTKNVFLARIPYDEKWGVEYSHNRNKVILEHMIQMPFDWWSKKLKESFNEEIWKETIIRVEGTNWKLFRYERKEK